MHVRKKRINLNKVEKLNAEPFFAVLRYIFLYGFSDQEFLALFTTLLKER